MTAENESYFRKTLVSRAELLLFLKKSEEHLEKMATFSGYQCEPESQEVGKKTEKPKQPDPATVVPPKQPKEKRQHYFAEPETGTKFWYVTECRYKKKEEITGEKPEWAKGEGFQNSDPLGMDYSKTPPITENLVPWSQLWPFLKSALITEYEKSIDVAKLIRLIAKLKPICRLPKKRSHTWANRCQIILDRSERLVPFWDDMDFVYRGIENLRGASGLQVFSIDGNPHEKFWIYNRPQEPAVDFPIPETATPILIVSDLGCFEKSGSATKSWLRFGQKMQKYRLYPVVLTPCPPRLWDKKLRKYFRLCWWDRGQKLPRVHKSSQSNVAARIDTSQSVDQLLALLSPAIRVEPALLRAVRLKLSKQFDSGVEAEVWNHPETLSCPIAFAYHPQAIEKYRTAFLEQDAELREQIFDIVKEHHKHLAAPVRYEEELAYHNLQQLPAGKAERFFEKIVCTMLSSDYQEQQELQSWGHRLSQRQHKDMWANPALASLWFKINYEKWKQGQIALKEGMDLDTIAWMIPENETVSQYTLFQVGEKLIISQEDNLREQEFSVGCPIATISASRPCLEIFREQKNSVEGSLLDLQKNSVGVCIPSEGHLVVSSDREEITVESLEKPVWAQSIARDSGGLYIISMQEDIANKLYWFPPGLYYGSGKNIFKSTGFWGNAAGVDEYGLWLDLSVKNVKFRMRWIEPGKFMMGSPEDEPERHSDEILHEVILTNGFWLADTACTQELWEIVMGNNSSEFKGDNRPVDNVSWNDCVDFLNAINRLMTLGFRFPTEAEWEYACRAGSKKQTPFSFGDNITTDQVNYDGNLPYNNGKKGEYRGQTVDVKSLPCNNWGLYEMHGNVREWCYDWFGDYTTDSIENPIGPKSGTICVLRGGDWVSFARFVRSAYRFRYSPGYRFAGYFGLRFALGHTSTGQAAELQKRKDE